MSLESYIAATRFGLGARPGELEKITDPKGWLLKQVAAPVTPPAIQAMTSSQEAQKAAADFQARKKAKEEGAGKYMRQTYVRQAAARFAAQVESNQPFIERLVMFWSNHFTVSVQKQNVVPFAVQYEGEAIRPHVTGNFFDMLLAVVKHPAMLMYLDNAQSIGPNSMVGQRRKKGLNENLAREILELHTMGVGSGYSQNDVIALAKIITGWSMNREKYVFSFENRMHEPGTKTLLGRSFPENGMEEGVQALRMIASHPATAKHIATKLARHFIADEPPPAAVQALADTFQKTGGNLAQVYKTLIELNDPWKTAQAKIKNPYEYVLSVCRLVNYKPDAKSLAQLFEALNYRVFNANSPAGYADVSSAWVSPDSLIKRIEWAKSFSQKHAPSMNPLTLAQQVFGPVMHTETAFVINGAASPQDGFAFLLSSPEFQRR